MNETFLLVIIFIAFLIWLFILKPKAEESRIEWERQQTKALARQEKHQEEARIERERQQAKARIKRERLNAEARSKQERQKAAAKKREKKSIEDKEQLLRKIRSTAPDFILKAKLEFEREFRSQTDQSFFGQEMSPLTCFGYWVGVPPSGGPI